MTATAIDHVSIVTGDLDKTAAFYAAVLDLERCDGPPPLRPDMVQWLHDASGRPIVHLVVAEMVADIIRPAVPGPHTGAIHHVAFDCADYAGKLACLESLGVAFQTRELPSISLRQVFIADPDCGVLLELNFRGG